MQRIEIPWAGLLAWNQSVRGTGVTWAANPIKCEKWRGSDCVALLPCRGPWLHWIL